MERDVLISHGMNAFLKESMLERGDKYYMAICNQTGMIAVFNPSKNLFMSPMADGPLRFIGTVDGKSMNIENITKFGRSFSVICVPYTFKLLLQELQTINIQMRIITEDNIHQLDNLSFSKNIDKLTHIENVKMKNIVTDLRSNALMPFKYLNEIYKTDENEPEYVPKLNNIALDESSMSADSVPYASVIGPTNYSPLGPPRDSPQFDPNASEQSVEEFDPWTETLKIQAREKGIAPPMTPPGSPNRMAGGNGESKREFAINDLVYYRGGTKSNTVWRVKDNMGGKFITIETDAPELLDNPDEMIKVVGHNDIFHCDELNSPYNMINQNQNQNQNQSLYPYQSQYQGLPSHGMMPQEININPTIKIVNGPDNSVETSDNTNKIPSSHFTTEDYPQNMNIVDMAHVPHKHSDENKVAADNGNIDFNNLVIKKV
jgi:hypothetical protein